MFHADSVGLKRIVEPIASFERESGQRWNVSPLLRQPGESGKTFRAYDKERAPRQD